MGKKFLLFFGKSGGKICIPLSKAFPMVVDDESQKAKDVGDELGVDWEIVSLDEFKMGLNEEMEHSDVTGGDLLTTGKIAIAHLKEDPKYYTKLKQMMGKVWTEEARQAALESRQRNKDYKAHLAAGTPAKVARALAEPKAKEYRDNTARVIRALRTGFGRKSE